VDGGIGAALVDELLEEDRGIGKARGDSGEQAGDEQKWGDSHECVKA
jgi:hypothetical protein